MGNCFIGKGAVRACGDIPVGGTKKFVMLYNYDEWRQNVNADKVTADANTLITNIVNDTGIQAFRFDVPDESALNFENPIRAVEGGYDAYDHMVGLSVILTDQDTKNNIDIMLNSQNVVAIVVTNDGVAVLYGTDQGLKLITNGYKPNDANLGGIIPIVLQTNSAGAAETHMPVNIFKNNAADTLALIESLTTIGP